MLDRIGVILQLMGMVLLITCIIVFCYTLFNFNTTCLLKIVVCLMGGKIGEYLIKLGDEMEYYRREVKK